MVLFGRGEPAKECARLPLRARLKRRVGLLAARGHRQKALPAILRRYVLTDQPSLVKPLQDAAQVTDIKAEIAGDVGRSRAVAMLDLVQHARLRQRKHAVEPAGLQHAEILRVKAVKA